MSDVRALYLREADIPRVAQAGESIDVVVRGDLPNPGWKFMRWDVEQVTSGGSDGGRSGWAVTPLIVNTLKPGEAVIQILVPFEGTARVDAPGGQGIVDIEVRGFAPDQTIRGSVEFVAANTLFDLEITGGFVGIRDRVTLADDGRLVARRSREGRSATGQLAASDLAAIRAARDAARLPDLPARTHTDNAADLFEYDLTDFGGARPVRVVADDLSATPELAALVRILREKANEILERSRP